VQSVCCCSPISLANISWFPSTFQKRPPQTRFPRPCLCDSTYFLGSPSRFQLLKLSVAPATPPPPPPTFVLTLTPRLLPPRPQHLLHSIRLHLRGVVINSHSTSWIMTSHQQAPVVVQRQQSSRHQRQSSSASRPTTSSRPVDPNSLHPPSSRDPEAPRSAPSAASSNRPPNSRTASAMSEAQSVTTNGTSAQGPSVGIPDDGNRQSHHPQRPKKTSIQGSTGTWILGKTIGAGSMGKVKLARKSDGSEQVRISPLTPHKNYALLLLTRFALWCLGCSQNCTQAGHPGAGNRPGDWTAIPSSPRR